MASLLRVDSQWQTPPAIKIFFLPTLPFSLPLEVLLAHCIYIPLESDIFLWLHLPAPSSGCPAARLGFGGPTVLVLLCTGSSEPQRFWPPHMFKEQFTLVLHWYSRHTFCFQSSDFQCVLPGHSSQIRLFLCCSIVSVGRWSSPQWFCLERYKSHCWYYFFTLCHLLNN